MAHAYDPTNIFARILRGAATHTEDLAEGEVLARLDASNLDAQLDLSRAQVAAFVGVDSRLVQKWEESDPRGQRSTMTPQQWAVVAELLGIVEVYVDVHRPFNVSADVPYTDVWSFPTVGRRVGKHPCEKPLAMMEHIIAASSRPGAVVLDPFMGSGVTGEAALRHGRQFIGIEADAGYFASAKARISAVTT